MEPVTTAMMIGAITTYVAQKVKENKAVSSFFDDFTTATIDWIKPAFVREDGSEKDVIADLKQKPDNDFNQKAVENAIAKAVANTANGEQHLQELYQALKAKTGETGYIDNSGAKIGQQNNNSTVHNNGASFDVS